MHQNFTRPCWERARLLKSGSLALKKVSENVEISEDKAILLNDIKEAFLTHIHIAELRDSGVKLLTLRSGTLELFELMDQQKRILNRSFLSGYE